MSRDWWLALLIRDHLPETDSWLQTYFSSTSITPARTLGQRVLMSGDGMSGGVSVEQSQFPAPLLLTWCSRSGADHTWERSSGEQCWGVTNLHWAALSVYHHSCPGTHHVTEISTNVVRDEVQWVTGCPDSDQTPAQPRWAAAEAGGWYLSVIWGWLRMR